MSGTSFTIEQLLPPPGRSPSIDHAADVLAAAFEQYPWTQWTVDARDHRERLRALYLLTLTGLVVPYGAAMVAVEHRCSTLSSSDGAGTPRRPAPAADAVAANGGIIGVAAWLRPGTVVPDQVLRDLASRSGALRGNRASAAETADETVSQHAFPDAHWYLGAIGVTPGAMSRGAGSALLSAGLARADSDGLPVRLETSLRRNVALYQRHGFRVVAQVELPPGAPPCWVMHRDPVPSA